MFFLSVHEVGTCSLVISFGTVKTITVLIKETYGIWYICLKDVVIQCLLKIYIVSSEKRQDIKSAENTRQSFTHCLWIYFPCIVDFPFRKIYISRKVTCQNPRKVNVKGLCVLCIFKQVIGLEIVT